MFENLFYAHGVAKNSNAYSEHYQKKISLVSFFNDQVKENNYGEPGGVTF